MRCALLIALLASTALAAGGRFQRTNQRTPQGRSDRGLLGDTPSALFEFAPVSGAGMGTACACTTPTGAKGETLTFTRTGNATCSKKGMSNTGIANGDLVTCSGNQPRVEPSNAVLGVRVEASRTNSCLQSEDFSSASWSKLGSPTITADAATAPDNATTADRVQFAATGVGASSLVYQIAAPVGAATCSVYARMTSGTGSLPMYVNLGGLYACATCSITDASWTRCTVSGTVVSNGTFNIGNESFAGVCFGALPALDVQLWGAQCESGAYETSYIATTSAAVTRNSEEAYVSSLTGLSQSQGSAAATINLLWGSSPSTDLVRVLWFDTNGRPLYTNRRDEIRVWDGTNEIINPWTVTRFSPTRLWSSWAGSTLSINDGQDTVTGAFDGTFGSGALSTIYIGNVSTNPGPLDGIITRVCLDSNPSRCR